MTADERHALERSWLALTRETLPGVASTRDWPIRADHCFARVLLDVACGGRWYDVIAARPAYAHAPDEVLQRAVDLAGAVADGTADLPAMNRQSLAWRRAAARP